MECILILTVHCCLASLLAHQLKVFINTFTKIVQEGEIAK